MPHRALWTWLFCAWLAFAPLAQACPPEFETQVSAYERVRAAPLLLWVEAVSATSGVAVAYSLGPDDFVTLEVREVLRGQLRTKRLRTPGRFVQADGPHAPEIGYFRQGASYLFFLNQLPDGDVVSLPFTPSGPAAAEEISAASPVLVNARHYARIAALGNPTAERAALLALQAQAKAASAGQRLPPALADEIAQHFQTPSVYKTYEELLALYRAPDASSSQKAYALWAMATAPKREARGLFEQMVRSGKWREQASAATQFVALTEDRPLASRLLAELPTIHDDSLRQRILGAAIGVVDAREQPAMLRALREADRDTLRSLAPWFVKYPSTAATALLKRSLKQPYQEDYELAFALASLGDADVLAWGQRMASSKDEEAWMGRYTIARSPLPLADRLARQIIREANEATLAELIQGYEHASQPNLWARLGDVVALPQRAPEVERWVKTVLKRRAEAGEPQALVLLRALDTRTPMAQ